MKKTSKQRSVDQPARKNRGASPSQMEQQITLTLYNQGSYAQVEQFSRSLTERYPNDGFGWKLMGAALMQLEKVEEALEPLQKAARLMPHDADAYNNLGCAHLHMNSLEHAKHCYLHALELKADHLDALSNLAETLKLLGDPDAALVYLKKKQQLTPGDESLAYAISMLAGKNPERPPPEYVSKLFDQYANTFDEHLKNNLSYTAPEQLVAIALEQVSAAVDGFDILDLGCGTGLVGQIIAPKAKHLVGVDLSAGMVDKARAKSLYTRLVVDDITSMMRCEESASYDIIIAADVFVYLGDLGIVMKECKRLLRQNGILAFSIEDDGFDHQRNPGDTEHSKYRLTSSGRYKHTRHYMSNLADACGLRVVFEKTAILRTEGSAPVNGCLLAWQLLV